MLVGYDCSDESEGEEEPLKLPKPVKKEFEEEGPVPPKKVYNSFVSMKVEGKMRIAAPSLKEFEEERPSGRSFTSSKKSSSLFSILPKPKCEETLVKFAPNILKRPTPMKIEQVKNKFFKKEKEFEVNDAEENEGQTSFFNFDASEQLGDEEFERLKMRVEEEVEVEEAKVQETKVEEEEAEEAPQQRQDILHLIPKTKNPQKINFIDIKADDLRSDPTTFLKTMTDASALPARRAKGLGGLQKKKHQITYLAVEAQAREQELQQEWASNRMNKRETRMKYGF